jgi:hypothetical protein
VDQLRADAAVGVRIYNARVEDFFTRAVGAQSRNSSGQRRRVANFGLLDVVHRRAALQ